MEVLLQDLFAANVVRRADSPAVIAAGRMLTYAQLETLSRGWAHRLQRLGARPNTLVAIVMEKGWEQIVAVLAVLRSGAAYLPVDPNVPAERLAFVLADSGAVVALTQSQIESKLSWPAGVTPLCVDRGTPEVSEEIACPASPADLAYVLYTSGSTGTPKGVMIAHRGVVNCIRETNRTFAITDKDRAIAITALHHDMSVYDIFGMLASGGAIVIPAANAGRSPDHWAELIAGERVTIWNSVPGFMEMFLEYAAGQNLKLHGHLRLAFLGGDWIPVSAPARIRKHFGDVQTVSVGGPTETTVWNIWYPVKEVDPSWRSIPYGRPIANTRYYVMNDALEECAPGQPGELCCAGVGVMQGYWKREELTRSRFAVHPQTGERIFRTGDRGRLLPGGEIEFLGRMDAQVKIGGQRIELGEIEANLAQHPGVKAAAVKVVQSGGHPKLAAYVVPGEESRPTAGGLKEFLELRIPGYMIPFAFVMLDALPLNANGKVDRDALPNPAPGNILDGVAISTQGAANPLEETILSVWSKTLNRGSRDANRIGLDDNFFDIGGNSLLLIEAHTELQRRLERQIPVTALFEFPTVRSLASDLNGEGAGRLAVADLDARSARQREAMARRRAASGRLGAPAR